MILPPYLKSGDTIAITCPSGYIPAEKIFFARDVLQGWGFNVALGNTVGQEHFYFADTDENRKADLQTFLDDASVNAILMGRGGYGMSRIIDDLNFNRFLQKPKWICGFSDITVMHSHIQGQFDIATLHSPMCGAFKPETIGLPHLLSLKAALSGDTIIYSELQHECNIDGEAEATLVGGNLAMLAHLTGSCSQINTKEKILFIEDIGEHLYNIDRMLYNLKRSGQINEIAGLVCGGFTDMLDTERPFGQNIYDIILDKVAELDIPVAFGFPIGHDDINYALKLGAPFRLEVKDKIAKLTEIKIANIV